ncbi:uncharacterized protein Dana_GF27327 [Drosophila ananassae]|uniref:Uncharacterized protein n=1 Tax=Drosophila ananassae TaxID=7217 RepID=A0A0P8XVK0_DROAN|nr:uncharacterized protein Dana_GF27327 [Drosophila ananassae]
MKIFMEAEHLTAHKTTSTRTNEANALHYNFIKDESLSPPAVKQRCVPGKKRATKSTSRGGESGESQKAARGDNSPKAHCLLLGAVKRKSRAWHFYEINTKDVAARSKSGSGSGSGSGSHDKSPSQRRTMMGGWGGLRLRKRL